MSSTSPLSPKHLDLKFSQWSSSGPFALLGCVSSLITPLLGDKLGCKAWHGALKDDTRERQHPSTPGIKRQRTYWVNFHVGWVGSSAATMFSIPPHNLEAAALIAATLHSPTTQYLTSEIISTSQNPLRPSVAASIRPTLVG